MKKLYTYIAIFTFLPLSVFASLPIRANYIKGDKLFFNIANAILTADKDSYLVITTQNQSLNIPKSMKSLSIDDYRAMITDSMNRFGISHNFLFVKESFCKKIEPFIVKWASNAINYDSITIDYDDVHLLILKSMYDKEGKLKVHHWSIKDKLYKEKLVNAKYIKFNNYFYVPSPEDENGICLFRKEYKSKSGKLYTKPIAYKKDLYEDVQILAKLFCDKKENLFTTGNLDLITKTIPQLKSKEGKKIAEAMVSIVEDEIIKVEFPESVKKQFEGAKNSIPKLDFDAVEKEYNKN